MVPWIEQGLKDQGVGARCAVRGENVVRGDRVIVQASNLPAELLTAVEWAKV